MFGYVVVYCCCLPLLFITMLEYVVVYCCGLLPCLNMLLFTAVVYYHAVVYCCCLLLFFITMLLFTVVVYCYCLQRIIRYIELIFTGHVNWASVVTSVLCIALLLVIDYLNMFLRRKVRKVPIHIPAQLIVVRTGCHMTVM